MSQTEQLNVTPISDMVKLTQAHLVMGLFVVKMKDGNHVGATVLSLPPPDPPTPNCYNTVMTEASFEVIAFNESEA